MKHKPLVLSIVSLFLFLGSCSINKNGNEDTTDSGSISVSTDTTSGHSKEWLKGKTINIYALNDFHGAVEETDINMGLGNMGTFFKKKGEEENTIILDQGDSWQGSIYSNINYGNLVNDVMCVAKFDARTVGNHDFDWGVDKLVANTSRSYNGYTIPALAANIYDYNFDTKTFGNTQQSQFGAPSKIITLENEVKVGVVGVIGSSQITSITSTYTHDIGFKDHVSIAKQEATNLRKQGCDFVICSIHGGQEDLLGHDMADYVDLVLCSHTHVRQWTVEDDRLLYLQAGRNGEAFGRVQITFTETGVDGNFSIVDYQNHKDLFGDVDPQIANLIATSKDECDEEANEVMVANASGKFGSGDLSKVDGSAAVNLMNKAIIDECKLQGYDDVIFSYTNYARTSIDKSEWTYADIYQAFPFDNEVYIIEATSSEIESNLTGHNWICKSDTFDNEIHYDQKYQIAVIDYLAFHTNSSRSYDFFPDNNGAYVAKLTLNYRDILVGWLKRNNYNTPSGPTLSASNFYDNVDRHDRSTIQYVYPTHTIHFDLNGGTLEDPSQVDAVGSINQYYSELYPSPDPTKDGYIFGGWYIDEDCTITANSKKINQDRTLYAKWIDESLGNGTITNSALNWSGNSQTWAYNSSISINLYWYNMTNNTQYSQMTLANNGYFELNAPSGYKFTRLYVKIYGSYNNLTFSTTGGTDVSDPHFVNSGSISSYDFNPSSQIVSIRNKSGHTTHMYEVTFEIEVA